VEKREPSPVKPKEPPKDPLTLKLEGLGLSITDIDTFKSLITELKANEDGQIKKDTFMKL